MVQEPRHLLSKTCHLIVLIGLPGSGKSTLARHLAQSQGWGLVSTDEIRARLFGDESVQGPWPLIWGEVERAFREASGAIALSGSSQLVSAHTLSTHTLYDATNAVRRQRREVIRLGRCCGFRWISGLWLDVPLPVCLERNMQRDRQVPEPVIERMHRRLMGAPPSLSDGLDTLIQLPPDFSPDPTTWDLGWFGKPHPQIL